MHENLRPFVIRHLGRVAVAVGLLASYPVLFAVAVLPSGAAGRLPWCWLFLAVAAISYLAELWAPQAVPYLVNTLNWLQVGVPLRWLFREAALIVLLGRVLSPGSALAVFAGGLLALHAVRAIYSGLVIYVRRRRTLPVVTRNVDLSELRIPDAPPAVLVEKYARTVLHLDTLPVTGGLVTAMTADYAWGFTGAALALAVGLALCVIMAVHALRNRHLRDKPLILATVRSQIVAYNPEIVLYFSGPRDSAYQVNMWLSTLANLKRPAMIIMRERGLVPLLGRTGLPVVCVGGTVELMNFELPSVKVALFPANTSKNLHQLRIPRVGHVFIGHGDSDKAASVNPFSKAYDEVWVAGKAGRDRYLRAQVGVRDDDIVEVGRPQLMGIQTADAGPADRMFTVLYAPTWEGWIDEQNQTSLTLMGLQIIKALIDSDPAIRVLYKPHPLTGNRDRGASAAHDALAAVVEAANQRRDAGEWAAEARAGEAGRREAAAGMARIEARMAELTRGTGPGESRWTSGLRPRKDDATLSRDSMPDSADDAEWQRLTDAWHAAYWASQGWWRHRVVTGPLPALYECFNHTDMLISDISSVVSDFIASGRPYVVTNPDDLDEDEFRDRFPTAAAGYLLGPGCAGLPRILAQAVAPGDDALAKARLKLRSYLLGPESPDALTRFSDAVEALAERVTKTAAPDVPLDLQPDAPPDVPPDGTVATDPDATVAAAPGATVGAAPAPGTQQ
jgi:hypothetical protein